jgi:hypothetical protein
MYVFGRSAEALVNVGLENRAIASTQMNATSSRSHTVLTVVVEQRFYENGTSDRDRTRKKVIGRRYSKLHSCRVLVMHVLEYMRASSGTNVYIFVFVTTA